MNEAQRCYIHSSKTPDSHRFWQAVLSDLGEGSDYELEVSKGTSEGSSKTGGLSGGVPGFLSGKVEATGSKALESGVVQRVSFPVEQTRAIDLLAQKRKTLVIDEFHYLTTEAQITLCRQLKDAADKGVPIAILAVPHRRQDPVRAVNDLKGRVAPVDLEPWTLAELMEISRKGFQELNVILDERWQRRLARESIGSPQLMQALSLETCAELRIEGKLETATAVTLTETDLIGICQRVAGTADYSDVHRALEAGPRKRRERVSYEMVDGRQGDVYGVILGALALNPLEQTLSFNDVLKQRVQRACISSYPPIQGVMARIETISDIASEIAESGTPRQDPVLEWRQPPGVIELPDVYFLFYLRWKIFPRFAG